MKNDNSWGQLLIDYFEASENWQRDGIALKAAKYLFGIDWFKFIKGARLIDSQAVYSLDFLKNFINYEDN